MTDPISPGERIRQRRKELRLKQQQLAEIAQISSGFMSEIEKGKRNPSGRVMLRLASALSTTTDWILQGDGGPEKRRDPTPLVIPPELSEAARDAGLSYASTASLLKAYNQVVAERGSKPNASPSAKEWMTMYAALKRYIEE